MHLPTTKQLRYLVALGEHRHFGRAAAACFVSQSAFSIAIRELEKLLGVKLIDRTNKQVTVTRLGQQVIAGASVCLSDLEGLVELAGGGREPLTGRLHLGVIPTIAPFVLPRILPALRRQYPGLKLYVKEGMTVRIHEDLMDGTLDALLIAMPYELRSVETLTLFRDHFLLACRDGSALIDPQNYRPSRLEADSVLLLEDGHCMRDQALSACRISGLEKVNPFAASSLLTLVQMVDSDLGISFLPEIALGSGLLKGTRVKTYPLPENSFREIALAWRSGSRRQQEMQLLGECIVKHAAPAATGAAPKRRRKKQPI
jgi:LysR family hydrogen peroxide-inducible transcriptional activator